MSYFIGPHLRIYTPELSLEQRKIMAQELTQAIGSALQLGQERHSSILIHFCVCPLDCTAVGGRLLSETEEPYYHMEFCGHALSQERRAALGRCLMPLMQELLNVPSSQGERISLVFNEVPPGDWLMGTRRISRPIKSMV